MLIETLRWYEDNAPAMQEGEVGLAPRRRVLHRPAAGGCARDRAVISLVAAGVSMAGISMLVSAGLGFGDTDHFWGVSLILFIGLVSWAVRR